MNYVFNQPKPPLITEEIDSSNSTFYNVIDNRQTRSFQKSPFIIANKLLHGHLRSERSSTHKKIHKGVFECFTVLHPETRLSKDNEFNCGGCFVVVWPHDKSVVHNYKKTKRRPCWIRVGEEAAYMSDQMMMRHWRWEVMFMLWHVDVGIGFLAIWGEGATFLSLHVPWGEWASTYTCIMVKPPKSVSFFFQMGLLLKKVSLRVKNESGWVSESKT